jgi:hypothetical protein
MLELAFDHRLAAPEAAADEDARLENALRAVAAARSEGGAIAGVGALLSTVGVRPGLMNEAYFAEALAFHLAQIYAHLRRAPEMVECVERSGVLPADGGDLLFPDHVARALALFERREAARKRGMPTFVIASMTRAASTSLTQTLAQSLDMPVVRVSLGRFPHFALAPSWLNSVTPGGGVLHDHFGATPHNLGVLRSSGVREVSVLVRDPRAAAASYVDFVEQNHTSGGGGAARREAIVASTFLQAHLPWLTQWIEASKSGELQVRWIRSRSVAADMATVWRDLVSAHAPLYPALDAYIETPPAKVRANFTGGVDDRWRSQVSQATRQAMWDALPPAAIELLELEP